MNKLYVYLASGQQEFALRLAWLLCVALRHLRSLHQFPNTRELLLLCLSNQLPLSGVVFWLQMCNMLGLGDMNADQLASKLEETLPVIRSVSEQFKDPVSTFVTSVAVTLCSLQIRFLGVIESECHVSLFSRCVQVNKHVH